MSHLVAASRNLNIFMKKRKKKASFRIYSPLKKIKKNKKTKWRQLALKSDINVLMP